MFDIERIATTRLGVSGLETGLTEEERSVREIPLVHRNTDHVVGRGGNTLRQCTLYSLDSYQTPGILQAAVARLLIGGHQQASGFSSACAAVGHRETLGQLRNFGLVEVAID